MEIDAVICPSYLSCAFKHENADDLGALLHHTALWNLLHFPCGVVPITNVLPEEH